MIKAIGIALSGLDNASKRLSATASNIANASTVGSANGEGQAPYSPVTSIQKTNEAGGVNTTIVPSGKPFVPSYDPDSPFADENGIIGAPDVNLATEAINSIVAELSYKANIEVIKTAEDMGDELLDIFDKNE